MKPKISHLICQILLIATTCTAGEGDVDPSKIYDKLNPDIYRNRDINFSPSPGIVRETITTSRVVYEVKYTPEVSALVTASAQTPQTNEMCLVEVRFIEAPTNAAPPIGLTTNSFADYMTNNPDVSLVVSPPIELHCGTETGCVGVVTEMLMPVGYAACSGSALNTNLAAIAVQPGVETQEVNISVWIKSEESATGRGYKLTFYTEVHTPTLTMDINPGRAFFPQTEPEISAFYERLKERMDRDRSVRCRTARHSVEIPDGSSLVYCCGLTDIGKTLYIVLKPKHP